MMRIGSWSIGVMACMGVAASAQAQVSVLPQMALVPQLSASGQTAPIKPAELNGIVRDERGNPLAGAVVSALGSSSAFAISDEEGRFSFRTLPPGPYLVRAHLPNYRQGRAPVVQIAPNGRTTSTIQLTRRADAAAAPTVLAAGVGPSEESEAPAQADEPHGHDEVSWRLRHLKRSVLRDAEATLEGLDDESLLGESFTGMSKALGNSARLASTLFSDLDLSGQLNLLTSTSFDRPQDLFSPHGVTPRGVAYLALQAPVARGTWSMRGTLTQGDLASWLVAGSYVSDRPATHAYEAGVAYGMQRYFGGNGEALAAMRDGSRNVGSVYAMDHWTVLPRLSVGYGAKYARYDYLSDRGLMSPSATITIQPSPDDSLTVRTTVARREVAPGAEEFLPPAIGVWLPPERTFSQVSHAAFLPERHDQVEVAVDRAVPWRFVVGFRAYRERVQDQVVTLFGVAVGDTPAEVGHYQVGSAGDFDAHGWGMRVSREVGDTLRASVDYTQSQTEWRRRSHDAAALASMAASVLRDDETIHDVTASLESLIAASATRVLVVYKLNTAYASASELESAPSAGVRFDVQVNQPLPFLNFTTAQWEMLVAVSNLFKDALYENSVYDELLVVRPPKRILGGVTVRF